MGVGRQVRTFVERSLGVSIRKIEAGNSRENPPHFYPAEFRRLFEKYRDYSTVGWTGFIAAWHGIQHVKANNVDGVVIECGVHRGGMAAFLAEISDRPTYLFDTFEGMSEPTDDDFKLMNGFKAAPIFESKERWCYGAIEEVQQVVELSSNPDVHFVKGKVEDTLPGFQCPPIALLRLDTDFYESTKAELEYLYPHVTKGGVIIVDDYGVWSGARKAVDEVITQAGHFFAHDAEYGALTIMKL